MRAGRGMNFSRRRLENAEEDFVMRFWCEFGAGGRPYSIQSTAMNTQQPTPRLSQAML